ncbi:MAG: 3-deoxy-manno-octulosonate cytidylyltransferase [Candidatus Zixiibacteriota bacterium]|nr:MAG: 3-deoxy-manno-octulosonate cytidylyltransferase [candidate division Zixibacteria bacterium]
MTPRVLVVIPARLGSRRFSNKAIYPLGGKPLLFYVHREVRRARGIGRLVIATDSHRVRRAAEGFGAEVVMTSSRHRTGSDRVAEAALKLGADIVVNFQGDNFGLKASSLENLIGRMKEDRRLRFATLACRIDSDDDLFDANKVKVVVGRDGRALWFSRFPLPYLQHATGGKRWRQYRFLRHVGVYAFRSKALADYARWPQTKLEKAESLEQLRILENGGDIRVFETRSAPVSVDSPHDLTKLKRLYI